MVISKLAKLKTIFYGRVESKYRLNVFKPQMQAGLVRTFIHTVYICETELLPFKHHSARSQKKKQTNSKAHWFCTKLSVH